jgi:hypothetical protein
MLLVPGLTPHRGVSEAMATISAPTTYEVRDHELRRLIDRSLGRALFDREYAARLLADPTVALGDSGCTPQQRRDLRNIRARTVAELAKRAHELFWMAPVNRVYKPDVPLTAAAG